MGMVWEAYRKGVPLLGVPENPTEMMFFTHPLSQLSSLGPGPFGR